MADATRVVHADDEALLLAGLASLLADFIDSLERVARGASVVDRPSCASSHRHAGETIR